MKWPEQRRLQPNGMAQRWYYPYGGVRWASGTFPTEYGFTGQRWEQSLGLYDYKARFYDPALGRFISADTVVPNPGNPQDLNRYAYVRNNPLRYTDPSGHALDPGGGGGEVDPLTRWLLEQYMAGGWYEHWSFAQFVAAYRSGMSSAAGLTGLDWGHAVSAEMANRLAGESSLDWAGVKWAAFSWLESDLWLAATAAAEGQRTAGFMGSLALLAPMPDVAGAGPGGGTYPGEEYQFNLGSTASRRSSNAIGRWGEQQVGQHLPVEVRQIPLRGRVYDGRVPSTGQFIEIKTTTRGVVYPNSHIRRQIAFDAAQRIKPLWIFVNGNPSRGLQVSLSEAGIPWQVLNVP